jgi:hypothetical protein
MKMFQTLATEELYGQLGNMATLPPQKRPLEFFEQDRSKERKENQM